MEEVKRKQRFYGERGVAAEILDAQTLYEAEPGLRSGLAGGLRIPSDAVIYPPCAAKHFVDKASERGACVFVGKPVIELSGKGAKLSDGTFISSGVALNATGHWAPQLTPGINVRKRKGHLVITDRYPGFVRHQLVELGYLKSAHSLTSDSVAFNVQPRRTGQVLVGSSRQYGVETDGVDQEILSQMIERATGFMPRLGTAAGYTCLDRLSCSDSGQASTDWQVCRGCQLVSCDGTRRPRHHHVACNCATCR